MKNIRKNLGRYKELITGSRLKKLDNNIKNYENELSKLKNQEKFLEDRWNRTFYAGLKIGHVKRYEIERKSPHKGAMYDKYFSNISRVNDNVRDKIRDLHNKEFEVSNLKLKNELDALAEEDLINATRKATAIGAAGLGGAGLATGGGVVAYKHFKKKKQQKNASNILDEMHMEKVAGIKQTATKKINRYKELITGSRAKRIEDSLAGHINKYDQAAKMVDKSFDNLEAMDKEYLARYPGKSNHIWLSEDIKSLNNDLGKRYKQELGNNSKWIKKRTAHNKLKDKRMNQLKDELVSVRRARIGTGLGGTGLVTGGLAYNHYKKNKERR